MRDLLPAGEYYIGDPCYVIDSWDEFLAPFWMQEPRGGVFDFDGYPVAAFYTLYGDGYYTLEPGGEGLPVDAGMIGAIPVVLMTKGGEADGALVSFDEPFECYEINGVLHFGDYTVETGDVDDGDTDEDYEDD